MNIVNLLGRLTTDPNYNDKSGTKVVHFTLAVDGVKDTDFIPVVAFNTQAEVINQYVGKGNRIAVTGYIHSRKYEDKDGKKMTVVEVIVNRFDLVDSKAKNEDKTVKPNGQVDTKKMMDDIDSYDLPF